MTLIERAAGNRRVGRILRAGSLSRSLLAAAISVLLANAAMATSTTLTVTVPQPSKSIGVVVGAYPGSSSFNISGSIDANLAVSGGVVSGLDLESADLVLSDVAITVAPGAVFHLLNVTATLVGAPALFLGSSAGTSSFDVAASQLIFDSGTAIVCCVGGTGQVDFAQTPVAFVYGPSSIAEITWLALTDGTLAASLLLPLDLSTAYPPESPAVFVSLSGDLAATGTIIPEPASGLLFAFGLASLGVSARRTHGARARMARRNVPARKSH